MECSNIQIHNKVLVVGSEVGVVDSHDCTTSKSFNVQSRSNYQTSKISIFIF
jgi:hypothetical protein